MTRAEFLEELRLTLQGEIGQAKVNENLRYYENYIIEESRKGKTEEQVIKELGNPRLIGRTIIDTSEHVGNAYDESYYEDSRSSDMPGKGLHIDRENDGRWNIHYGRFQLNSWYGILILVLVLLIIFIIIGRIFIVLLPVIFMVAVVWLIVKMFSGTKR